jgi:hypothetical protein
VDKNLKLNADPSILLFGNEPDDVREVFGTDVFNTII